MHLGQALHGVLNLRVHTDVEELGGLDSHVMQLVDDGVAGAHLIQVGVGDDEGPLEVVDLFHLTQSHGGAAGLVVDLLGQLQPQHVLLAHGDDLDIQQLLVVGVAHVGGVADSAGTQGQGRGNVEVIQIADAAEGGGRVDQDTAGFHLLGEAVNLLLLGGVDVQRGGVAGTALIDQLGADVIGLVQSVGLEHAQQGSQLLIGPGVVMGGVVRLIDQHLGVIGNRDTGHLRQTGGGLADGGGLDAVILGIEEHLGYLGGLFVVQEIAAGILHQSFDFVIDTAQDGDMLLRRANHTVVEGLGVDDGLHSHAQVGGLVDDDVAVAGADADGGSTGGVGRVHHAGAASGHDQVHLLHQHVGDVQRGRLDPADDMLGQARFNGGVPHDPRRGDGAFHSVGMGRKNNGVSGLQRQHDLVNRGRGGVRGGGNGGNHALGRGHTLGAERGILLNDTAGLGIAHVVPDMLGGVLVLRHLVDHDAVAGLLTGHLGQRNPHLGYRHGSLFANGVHLLLSKVAYFSCEARMMGSACSRDSTELMINAFAIIFLHFRLVVQYHVLAAGCECRVAYSDSFLLLNG